MSANTSEDLHPRYKLLWCKFGKALY